MKKLFKMGGAFSPAKEILPYTKEAISKKYDEVSSLTSSSTWKGRGTITSSVYEWIAIPVLAMAFQANGADPTEFLGISVAVAENADKGVSVEVAHENFTELFCTTEKFMPYTANAAVVNRIGNLSPYSIATMEAYAPFVALLKHLERSKDLQIEIQNYLAEIICDVGKFIEEKIPMDECPALSQLCDLIYRAVENDLECVSAFDVNNIKDIKKTALDKGRFGGSDIYPKGSTFSYLNGKSTVTRKKVGHKPMNFEEAVNLLRKEKGYKEFISSVNLTEDEKKLIPAIDDKIVIPKEAIEICHAIITDNCQRNFGLFGEPGSGKTTTAKIIAALMGIPYLVLSCSGGMDEMSVAGGIVPNAQTKEGSETTPVKRWNACCSIEDINIDPAMAYESLTGVKKDDITSAQVFQYILENELKSDNDFVYVESPLVRALTNGWLVEIQEPTLVADPRVLPIINDFILLGGRINLGNGDVRWRNDNGISIITSNINCNGCSPLNGSIISRLNLLKIVDLPEKAVLIQRAVNETGFSETETLESMVEVLCEINQYCNDNSVFEGSYGYRELVNWIKAYQNSYFNAGNAYASSIDTIVNKVSLDKSVRQDIVSIITNYFT